LILRILRECAARGLIVGEVFSHRKLWLNTLYRWIELRALLNSSPNYGEIFSMEGRVSARGHHAERGANAWTSSQVAQDSKPRLLTSR
jgi:hypothetical protein